ncbi:MAG: ABC transporter ATP-binding protein [Bacteroidetes bacterium]|jgi:putative ABC transport system ATP-binding protein|nr:ABC transporter ATP-binding protein [Bacteroidota bacterium]
MTIPILQAEALEKTYHDNGVPVRALVPIDVAFDQGEFTVIAGPSGSGKTTLLNLLGALDAPTGGRVLFNGRPLEGLSKTELSKLRLHQFGFIFQAYNLIPVFTAVENIEFVLTLQGVAERDRRRRALEVMKELDIEALAHKRPNQMSGGQQQRVAIGRAIATNPAIILADEPTANLDSATGGVLLDLMTHMNQEHGITFLFSSHDPQVIERGRRVIRLHDGRIERDDRRPGA